MDLVRFLIEDWSTNPCHINVIRSTKIYATVEDKAFLIKLHTGVPGKERIVTLESNQEEADIKVFLCAQFAVTWNISFITIVTVNIDIYYLKSVRIRSYPGAHFPAFGLNTERCISLYSLGMRENADQNDSEYGHFLRND